MKRIWPYVAVMLLCGGYAMCAAYFHGPRRDRVAGAPAGAGAKTSAAVEPSAPAVNGGSRDRGELRPVLAAALPENDPAPRRSSLSFEQEPRDAAWAGEHERELQQRLRRVVDGLAGRSIAVDIDGVECRRTLCRVAVHARAEAALGSLIGALEGPAGLAGWVDALLVEPVAVAADGQVTGRIVAAFERE